MPKYQVDLSVTVRLTVTHEAPDIDAAWGAGDRITADALEVCHPVHIDTGLMSYIIHPKGAIVLADGAALVDYYLGEVEMVRALPEDAA